MKLSDYVYLPDDMEKSAFQNLRNMLRIDLDDDILKSIILVSLQTSIEHKTMLTYGAAADKKIDAFNTGLRIKKGDNSERIWVYMLYNSNQNNKKYFGLFFVRETMLRGKIYKSEKKLHIGDILFNSISDIDKFIDDLADLAIKEEWNFAKDKATGYRSNFSKSILRAYLENTYFQVQFEGKMAFDASEKKMFFNTGLINNQFKEIFIMCDVVEHQKIDGLFNKTYRNPKPILEDDNVLRRSIEEENLPQKTIFYEDEKELIFDVKIAKRGIALNEDHIFEDNIKRIPKRYRDQPISTLRTLFERATIQSVKLAERNYKLAAPQYWPATAEIQFLLPIYLSCAPGVGLPDCALSVNLMKDWKTPQYKGLTILTLGMAYSNARLIAKPDSFWLEPSKICESESTSDFDLIDVSPSVVSNDLKDDLSVHIGQVFNCKVKWLNDKGFLKVEILDINLDGNIHVKELPENLHNELNNSKNSLDGRTVKARAYGIHQNSGLQLSVIRASDPAEV